MEGLAEKERQAETEGLAEVEELAEIDGLVVVETADLWLLAISRHFAGDGGVEKRAPFGRSLEIKIYE